MTSSGSLCSTQPALDGELAEVLQVYSRLEGPDGRPISSLRSAWRPGVGLAAACYLAPPELRDPGRAGVPVWWTWPAASWSDGDRRDELLLGAALALATTVDQWPSSAAPSVPRLRVVTSDAAADGSPASEVLDQIKVAVACPSDLRGRCFPDLDPTAVPRPGALDRICLAAAVLILPPGLRRRASGGSPQMWPWPDPYWTGDRGDRCDELVDALWLALTALRTMDRLTMTCRPGLLVVPGGDR